MNNYTFAELCLGQKESFSTTITSEMMDKFLAITGDDNPLHTEAKVVYGMLIASFYSTLVGVYLPGEHCLLRRIKTSFHRPTQIGDKLEITGEVVELHESTATAIVKARITNGGRLISKAKIEVGLRDGLA